VTHTLLATRVLILELGNVVNILIDDDVQAGAFAVVGRNVL
jgi:hypothetical protein